MSLNRDKLGCLLDVLDQAGLKPLLHHYKGGSAYIKFLTPIHGTLRIADHPQRSRYHYRWNLRSDYNEVTLKDTGDDGSSYYYPMAMFETMVGDMLYYLLLMEGK